MINFKYWIDKYNWNNGANVYTNTNITEFSKYNGTPAECVIDINILTSEINEENINQKNSEILKVIDLINQWGGQTSRMFYSRHVKNNFESPRDRISSNPNLEIYKQGIILSKKINEKAFSIFRNIYGINESFGGKHAMFWSDFNLIILDNKIAGSLGYKTPKQLLSVLTYQEILNKFRDIQNQNNFANPTMVERAFFAFHNNYFKNNNSEFKNNISDFTDIEEAIKIGSKLDIEIPNKIKTR